MKIGVITYWYGNDNYGMLLQCWALQQYLKEQGHTPFVIRYRGTGSPLKKLVKKCLSYSLRCVSKKARKDAENRSILLHYNEEKNKIRKFEEFRQQYLDLSDRYYSRIYDLRKNPPVADCYIAGSDQIWVSPLKYPDSWAYFLSFGDKNIRRISYAPSFGQNGYPKEDLGKLKRALAVFDYISCRENDGVITCRQLGYNAVKTEDSTLLLSHHYYDSLCEPINYDNHIFIYSVNMVKSEDIYWSTLKEKFIEKDIVITPASGNTVGTELFGKKAKYLYATPGQWLSLIKKSNLVVTSSFHGVVFCILFNKRFAYVPLTNSYSSSNNRITDLLSALNLDFTIVSCPEDYDRIMQEKFDWEVINEEKDRLLSSSKYFLQESLC